MKSDDRDSYIFVLLGIENPRIGFYIASIGQSAANIRIIDFNGLLMDAAAVTSSGRR